MNNNNDGSQGNKKLDTHEEYTQAYINVLNTYNTQIENTMKSRNQLKRSFFYLIRLIMLGLIFLFFITIVISFLLFYLMVLRDYKSATVVTGAVTALISTFSTMLLSIFKLPRLIAKYLFNKNEDRSMSEIIKNIQQYEIESVKITNTAKHTPPKEANDGSIDYSPLPTSTNVSQEDENVSS